ncbi:conserved protein of unknown function [Methylorubrum extorquens]|uniref:Uncharacterized protein n=1 Tax=Methylorubrum extorquens TaxID=408 RepID=A0A2N9AHE6_METEX|nr:conserved protein of unknown function [Methylorubrum extorquens]
MLALAQDLLAAGIALALYVAGALLILGRCQRLAPPLRALPSTSNDNRPAMSTPRPAAAPSVDVSAMSIAAGMGSIAVLCTLAVVACARAHGWL